MKHSRHIHRLLLLMSVVPLRFDGLVAGVPPVEPLTVGVSTASMDSVSGSHDLDMVVVTATRTPRPLKDVPVLTRVITARDIEQVDAGDVRELMMQELPGVEFTYNMGQQMQIRMSGFSGSSVLFLVDGERLAGETLDNVDYARLDLAGVERVEIVKGAASTLYGSQAAGGVVNIITRRETEPWTLNLRSRYGSHNDWRNNMTLTARSGKWYSQTTAQQTSSDAIRLSRHDALTTIYERRCVNVREKLVYAPNEQWRINVRGEYLFREREPEYQPTEGYRDYSGGMKAEWNPSDNNHVEVSYAYDQYDKCDYNHATRRNVRDYSNVQHIARFLVNHTVSGRHTLTIGGDYIHDHLMTYQFADGGIEEQDMADGFVQYDYNPNERWNVLGGVRYDWFSRSDGDVTAKAAAMRKWDNFSLRASYAGGFRAPTLKEMFMHFDMAGVFTIYGTRDLKSEHSHNFTVTGEHFGELGSWGKYDLTLSGYYNTVNHRITTAWNTALDGMKYFNMSQVRIVGLDFNASASFDCGIRANVAYNYTHEHIAKGQPELSAQRPHSLTLRTSYDHQFNDNYGFCWTFSGRYLSDMDVEEYTSLTNYTTTREVHYPGYSLWKLMLAQRVWRGLTVNLSVDNIFDYRPKTYYVNAPATDGRTYSIGLSVDVEKMKK